LARPAFADLLHDGPVRARTRAGRAHVLGIVTEAECKPDSY
jgi:hypothetical protein